MEDYELDDRELCEWLYRQEAKSESREFSRVIQLITRLAEENDQLREDKISLLKTSSSFESRMVDAEARLALAVEWVREARKFCQDGLSGDGCTPDQALERIHEASGDFLAKLEGQS